MEEGAKYGQYTKEELIQIILELKKEIEALKHPGEKTIQLPRSYFGWTDDDEYADEAFTDWDKAV